MPKRRHSEEQIITILREGDAGGAIGGLCRRHGISKNTYHRWKAQYGGLQVDEARIATRLSGAPQIFRNDRSRHLLPPR